MSRVTDVQEKLSKAKVVEWKAENKEVPKGAICRRIEAKKEEGTPKKPKIGD